MIYLEWETGPTLGSWIKIMVVEGRRTSRTMGVAGIPWRSSVRWKSNGLRLSIWSEQIRIRLKFRSKFVEFKMYEFISSLSGQAIWVTTRTISLLLYQTIYIVVFSFSFFSISQCVPFCTNHRDFTNGRHFRHESRDVLTLVTGLYVVA